VRWTAIVNPIAGRGRTRKLLPRLAPALEGQGVRVYVSTSADDGRREARDALADGRGVVACGGDGTVSELAAEAAAAGGAFAVIPTGAGNDFARHLGIDPKKPFDAVPLLAEGRFGLVDLGRTTTADGITSSFTTVANTGFDVEVNRWANRVRWLSGTSLYVLATLRMIFTYRRRHLRLVVDGATWEGKAWLVAFGNARYYGGGMMIVPGAEIDDGLLDVCVIGDMSPAALLWKFPRVFTGKLVRDRRVLTFRGARVSIEADGASIPPELWASGEPVGPLPAQLDVAAGALRVLVPLESPVRAAPDAPRVT